MVAKRVGTNSTISVFLSFASPSPHTLLIYLEIWVQSLGTGIRFVLANIISSEPNIAPGGGGYRCDLRGDVLFSAAFQLLLAMDCSISVGIFSYEG